MVIRWSHLRFQRCEDRLKIRSVPEEDKGRYHTLSSIVILLFKGGCQPQVVLQSGMAGDLVVDMDGKRVDKVLVSSLMHDANETEAEPDSP